MADRRLKVFAIVCAGGLLLAGGYAALALWRSVPAGAPEAAARLSAPPPPPALMVLGTASDDTFRKIVLAPLASPSGPGYTTTLSCERMSFAGGRGVCMTQEGVIPSYYADVFDERFNRVHRIALTGLPSRTRLSPDGRRAAVTVFEQGHSYAGSGFSTRTTIIDTVSGQALGDLEQFAISRDGQRFQAVDFNFWGVTFARDGNRFFATLATGGEKYLVEGRVDERAAHVVRSGVECPSLSPDNTRIVYKSMVSQAGVWRLRMYDLRTQADTPLAETRSVDDQVEWLDDERVVYQLSGAESSDVWVLPTGGTDAPRVLRAFASSPAVVR